MTLPTELITLFDAAVDRGASDIHLVADAAPRIRVDGELLRLSDTPPLSLETIDSLFLPLFPAFTQNGLRNGTIPAHEVLVSHGKFNFVVVVLRSNGNISVTVRILSAHVPTLDQIGFDCVDFFRNLTKTPYGLILITGPVGSGKQTTALALLQEINASLPGSRIYLLEDSLSHRLQSVNGLVSSLLIGQDVPDYETAMRLLMRLDPDVVFLNDLPDAQTAQSAITLARHGHLVIANANAPSAAHALKTIYRAWPTGTLPALAETLVAVTNQRLLKKSDGKGRIPAYEIISITEKLREAIRSGLDIEVVLSETVAEDNESRTLPEMMTRLIREGAITDSEAAAALRDYPATF